MQLPLALRNYDPATGFVLSAALPALTACGKSSPPPQSSAIDSYLQLPGRCAERLESGAYAKGEKDNTKRRERAMAAGRSCLMSGN